MTARQPPVNKSSTRSAGAKKPTAGSRAASPRKAAPRTTSATPAPAKAARRKSAPASLEAGADTPILPVDQLERLHAIKPGAVDWVIQQTQIEAEHRREETSRVNGFILLEHLLGQALALVIGAAGILGGSWVAVNGQPLAGATIAVSTVAGLTIAHLAGKKTRQ